MKNSEDKLTITYETLDDYYDLYVSGLNAISSGSLYLTSSDNMLNNQSNIIINGVDSGEVGESYEFDVISDTCIRVNDFQPIGSGELDFIFVNDGALYKLSEMFDYGYHLINVVFNATYVWDSDLTSISFVADGSVSDKFSSAFEAGAIRITDNGQYVYIPKALNGGLYQYEMTTPWDITTLTFVRNIGDTEWENARCFGMDFNSDGTKFYSIYGNSGYTNEALIYHYTLSTPWDISTLTRDGEVTLSAPGIIYSSSMQFKEDGTKLWISGHWLDGTEDIYQYSLSTAWDISTASLQGSYHDATYSFSGFYISEDGAKLVGIKKDTNYIAEFNLATKYDITGTVSFVQEIDVGIGNSINMRIYERVGKLYQFVTAGWTIFEYDVNKT